MNRTTWALAGVAVLVFATVGGLVATSGASPTTTTLQQPATTARVEKGDLSAMVTLPGTLTYRARPDGSPYVVVGQARGTYTALPEVGDTVACGTVLYRVDDRPVLLLCGTVPAYRDLHAGDEGPDVRQLNQNLHALGYDHTSGAGNIAFTSKTQRGLEQLEHDKGLEVTGALAVGDAVFLPDAVRIAKVVGALGGPAQPGAQVVQATSDTLEVQVDLEASQQGQVQKGDRAQITLPGNVSVTGTVDRLGRVARTTGKDDSVGDAIIPASLRLDDPGQARGLDAAPVEVAITTEGVANALSVPVTAIVGTAHGFAVEVVRDGGVHHLVPVTLGLFDTGAGRVQVEGDVGAGDHVVVPTT